MSRLGGRSRAWLIITLTLAMLAGTSVLPAIANTQGTFSSLPCPGISLNVKLGTTTGPCSVCRRLARLGQRSAVPR
jgi:hypothetical protein